MTEHQQHEATEGLPPQAILYDLIDGFTRTQCISVVSKLGVADELATGPKTAEELGQAVAAHPRELRRVLRAVASLGIFAEDREGRFHLTPLAETLRSDVPGSMRDFAVLYGQPWYWRPWGDLLNSVKTGETPFSRVHGKDVFAYLTGDAEAASTFNRALASVTSQGVDSILKAYNFARFASVVDVGGGNGTLIAGILNAFPETHGVLFDLPYIVEEAESFIGDAGVSDRCRVVGGDFFDSVPDGCDAYVLKFVVHDWDDERTITILKNCRRAIRNDGTLLLIERGIIPIGNDPAPIKFMDMHMMVVTGGIERTEAEISELFARAGFKLTRVIETDSPDNVIVEGVPV